MEHRQSASSSQKHWHFSHQKWTGESGTDRQSSAAGSHTTASFGLNTRPKTAQQLFSRGDSGDYYSHVNMNAQDDQQQRYLRDKTNLMHLMEGKSKSKNNISQQQTQQYSARLSASAATQGSSSRREDYVEHNKRTIQKMSAVSKKKGHSSSNFRQLESASSKYSRQMHTLETESRDQENARLARQRIDMQTISEPTLVSPGVDYRDGRSSRNTPLPHSQDHGSLDAEAEYSGLETRLSVYRRDDSLDSANEHRIRQFLPNENYDRSSSQGRAQYGRRCQESSEDSFQKQAFKSDQQFQIGRNNHGSSLQNQAVIQSQSVTCMSQHLYAQSYATRSQTATGQSRTSKPRNSEIMKAGTQDQAQQHNVANYLLAQPSQMVSYGRRDDKGSSAAQAQPTSSSQNLQYGAQVSPSKRNNYGDKYKQPSSNLLQKTTMDGYMNQLQTSGGTSGFKNSGAGQEVDDIHQHHSNISKQQMIQNLNQRYLAQNQSIGAHQPTNLLNGQPFEHSGASSKVTNTVDSAKQTGGRQKSRTVGKSQTQHAATAHQTTSSNANHGHASVKHTKASQAKTATNLYPRKSATTSYATNHTQSTHAGTNQKSGGLSGAGHTNTALYSTTRQSLQQRQERPSIVQTQGNGNIESPMIANPPENGKTFNGSVTTGHVQHRFADTVPSSKSGKGLQKGNSSATSHSRPSTAGHNIQGRNLNSNHNSHKTNQGLSKAATAEQDPGHNAQTVLAVNVIPTNSFGTSASNTTSYHRSATHTEGHNSVKQTTSGHATSQQRPSTAAAQRNAKTLQQLKGTGSSNGGHIAATRQAAQGHRNSQLHGGSHINTAKSAGRVSTHHATSSHAQKANSGSHQAKQINLNSNILTEETSEPTLQEMNQMEDFMRASQKSTNIFSQIPPDSSEIGRTGSRCGDRMITTIARDSIDVSTISVHEQSKTMLQQQERQSLHQRSQKRNPKKAQAPGMNNSNMLNDISVTSPGHELQVSMIPATPERMQKAKLRLETVCLLLAEKTGHSGTEKQKQQAAITNVLEELVFEQSSKYDQQCLRLLMDFQWQTAGNAHTLKLQDELAEVKTRFEIQTQLTKENKELKEQLAKQKYLVQDQDRQIRKLESELSQVKAEYQVDNRETRIRAQQSNRPERAASQQNRRSTGLVPPLDLSKVKGYEQHIRDKQVAQIQYKQKTQVAQQPKPVQKSAGRDQSAAKTLIEKSGSAAVAPTQKQMQTIQHKSTKMNNFMANDEVTLTIMDNLVAAQRPNIHQTNNAANKAAGQEHRSINSHSMSPSMKGGKGRNQSNYLNHMRQSQENRQVSSSTYYNNVNTSIDQIRQSHNHSATIESRHDDRPQGESFQTDSQHQSQIMSRKKSMPPSQVHIPLLDFSKLHKPQQPTQSRAATKSMQPKQSMVQQKFTTIDHSAAPSNGNKYSHNTSQQQSKQQQQQHHYSMGQASQQQSQTIVHHHQQQAPLHQYVGNGVRDFHKQLYDQKKRTNYEQSSGSLTQSLDLQRTSMAKDSANGSIGASQSMKVMAQSVDDSHQQYQVYSSSNGNLANKKLSSQLSANGSQNGGAAQTLTHQRNSATSSNGLQHPYQTHLQPQLSASGQLQPQSKQMMPLNFKADFNTVSH